MLFAGNRKLLLLWLISIYAFSSVAEITFRIKYEDALTHEEKTRDLSQRVPEDSNDDVVVTHSNMHKTLVLLKMAQAMQTAIKGYNKSGKDFEKLWSNYQDLVRAKDALKNEVEENNFLNKNWTKEQKRFRPFKLASRLARNMRPEKKETRSSSGGTARGGGGSSFSISTGGAQSAGKFSTTINNGNIPQLSDLTIGGFLKDYNLQLDTPLSEEGEIQLTSGVAIDRATMKAYVQITPYVRTSKAQEKHRPLNISIAIDISGSMTTKTDGVTRMQWARDAAIGILKTMKNGDRLSIFTFDVDTQLIQPTIILTEETKKDIEKKIAQISASYRRTDLEKALRQSYKSVATEKLLMEDSKSFQHSVVLISDAQANEGETSGNELKLIVANNALNSIGLVAVGIGSADGTDPGFDVALVDAIAKSRGGSYDFVSSEEDMKRVVEKIPNLLNPIAYNFNALITGVPEDWELHRVYGTSASEDRPPRSKELINAATFVLSNDGGAIVLEYNIKNGNGFARIKGSDNKTRAFKKLQNVYFLLDENAQQSEATIENITEKDILLRVTKTEGIESNFILTLNFENDSSIINSLRHRNCFKQCSAAKTGRNMVPVKDHGAGYYFKCLTCSEDTRQAICPWCIPCHQGHKLTLEYSPTANYYCDCSYGVLEKQTEHPVLKKQCLAKDKIEVKQFEDLNYVGVAFKNNRGGHTIMIKEKANQDDEKLLDFCDILVTQGKEQLLLPIDVLNLIGAKYKYLTLDEERNSSKIEKIGFEEQFNNFIEFN